MSQWVVMSQYHVFVGVVVICDDDYSESRQGAL